MDNSFIREYPNALSLNVCSQLIGFFDETITNGTIFTNQGSEQNGGGVNRSDTSLFLHMANPTTSEIVNDIVGKHWEKYIDEFAFLQNHNVTSYAIKFQRTPPMGGFHAWHWEHNAHHMNRDRLAVWTIYLTSHEDEGETEFLAHGKKVKAEAGKLCIFPADYTAVHRGNPVYKKPKYILTGWYHYVD